jgi:PAS domain S-box-containing protein
MAEIPSIPPDEPLHALLKRQLRKSGLPEILPSGPDNPWAKLLGHVNAAYLQADQDRYTLERSISISSREMQELNRNLKISKGQLARERDRLEAILGSLSDVVWSSTADHSSLLYVNPAFRSVYGRPETELHADPDLWMKVIHAEDAAEVRAAMESIAGGGFAEREYRVLRPEGEIRWVRHRLQVIADAEGHPLRFDALCSDITEKKRVELEMIEAKEAALSATKVKSQFLANMSHEVRTPLNGVMGMAQLLLDTPLTDRQKQMADVILESSHSLLAIINDVLDISKIESGMLKVRQEPFDVRKVMDEIISLLRPKAAGKGLRLATSVNGNLPTHVLGDALRLKQVMLNLAGNALKFTDRGEVVLHAEGGAAMGESVFLRCEIKDTGPGIPPEARSRLFRPFSQVDGSTTRRHGGTGLGLFISRQLVELMEGEIGHEDRPGGGSLFWFTVKLKRNPEALASPASRLPIPPNAARALAKILLVEDNSVNQRVFQSMLEHLGCRCDLASNGEEALQAMVKGGYDLVFMDCQMPVMDGYTAARAARSMPALSGLPIVAMTALAMPGDKEKCLEAGMNDYLGKPISLSGLASILDKWLPVPTKARAS